MDAVREAGGFQFLAGRSQLQATEVNIVHAKQGQDAIVAGTFRDGDRVIRSIVATAREQNAMSGS